MKIHDYYPAVFNINVMYIQQSYTRIMLINYSLVDTFLLQCLEWGKN